jgi:class 3 adenylate cyclase
LNKDYGTRIIVSEQTRARIEPGKYAFRALGEVSVRGRQKPVQIYTIDS